MASLCVLIFALIGCNTTNIPEIFQVLTLLRFASLTVTICIKEYNLKFYFVIFSYQLPSHLQNLNKPQAVPLKRSMVMLTDVKTVNKVVSSVHITSRWTAEVVILTAKIFLTFISSFCDSIYVTDIYSVFHLHLPGYVNQLFSDQIPVGLQAQYLF